MKYYLYYHKASFIHHARFGYIDTEAYTWGFSDSLNCLGLHHEIRDDCIPGIWKLNLTTVEDIIYHPDVIILNVSADEEFIKQYPEYQI